MRTHTCTNKHATAPPGHLHKRSCCCCDKVPCPKAICGRKGWSGLTVPEAQHGEKAWHSRGQYGWSCFQTYGGNREKEQEVRRSHQPSMSAHPTLVMPSSSQAPTSKGSITSSNSIPSLEQVFKCMNESGTFLFKPLPHSTPKLEFHPPWPAFYNSYWSKQRWCTTASLHIHVSLKNFLRATRKDLLVAVPSSPSRMISSESCCRLSSSHEQPRDAESQSAGSEHKVLIPGVGQAPASSLCDLALPLNIECTQGRVKTPESWMNSSSSRLPIYHHLFIVYFMVLSTQCLIISSSFLLLQIHPSFQCGTLCFFFKYHSY